MIVPGLVLLCLLSAGSAGGPVEHLDHNMQVRQVALDAWVVTDTDYFWSNTLVVRMADGTVILASSPYEDLGTKTLLDWIRRRLEPERMIAINTHFHLDGTGGNHAYQKAGVETWSSRETALLQRRESAKVRTETLDYYESDELRERVLNTRITLAENLFDQATGKVFELGGERVEVRFPGHAHAPDNVVVWFPARKLLFGGCIVKPKKLGYLRDADVSGWPAAVRKLLELDAEIVVPGHGKAGGREMLTKTLAVAKQAAKQPLHHRDATSQ